MQGTQYKEMVHLDISTQNTVFNLELYKTTATDSSNLG